MWLDHGNSQRAIILLESLLRYFVGNALIFLEGDLSHCELKGIEVITNYQAKNSQSGERVILPVESSTLDYIIRQILPRAGIRKRIQSIKIEKNGKWVFISYDWFDKGGVLITPEVGEDFLNNLVKIKAIWKYKLVEIQPNL